jgi:hypothetical protein
MAHSRTTCILEDPHRVHIPDVLSGTPLADIESLDIIGPLCEIQRTAYDTELQIGANFIFKKARLRQKEI